NPCSNDAVVSASHVRAPECAATARGTPLAHRPRGAIVAPIPHIRRTRKARVMKNAVRLRAIARLLFLLGLAPAARAGAQTPVSPVEWTNLVKAAATGSALQKTGTCGSCSDAGGVSVQTIKGADGYVEFVPGAGARSWVGLGTTATADTSPSLIDF